MFQTERALWRQLGSIESAFAPTPNPRRRLRLWLGKKRGRTPAVAASATAALLAVIMAPDLAIMMEADHRTATGEIREIELADGSKAILDTGSAIAVDFNAGTRNIRLLSGRAWFAVRHGDARPFRVAALDGVTEDIGTAFEVDRTSEHEVRVGVTEGLVEVSSPGSVHPLLLKAGNHARYAEGGMVRRIAGAPASATASWRDGELLIRNISVDAAITTLARYRRGNVFTFGETAGLARVSGTFRTDRPDDAIRTIASMRGLSVTRLPLGIMIVRSPGSD
ncbi:FecR family protein [Sphingopyxis fribergensis]|uniref:FecR family protein n=1 Tax=Sphingopyxis fribergensis TaxID=1515612 RepID=UPI000691BF35|nr:FecR domain-containing protein [Sphingopyxis fribergensis]